MKPTKSSARSRAEHEADEFVKRARAEGLRSRASYKLLEVDARFGLLAQGMTVVDLGAAPGGWSQVAAEKSLANSAKSKAGKTNRQGQVISVDLLPMAPLPGVTCIQGDFTEQPVLDKLLAELDGQKADLVISDMAPNLSGIRQIDQPQAVYLVELALEFAELALCRGGKLLAKAFEGEGIDALRAEFRSRFGSMNNVKPRASRPKSREVYLLGKDYLG